MKSLKKLINVGLSAFMCAIPTLPNQVLGSEIEIDPIQADLDLYGSEIIEEDIIYDEELGIDRLREEYMKNNVARGPVYDDEFGAKYKKYFKKVSWINRGGVWSLSVTYQWGNGISGHKDDSYDILLRFHHNDSRWVDAKKKNPSTYDSVWHQYACHYDWVRGNKNPYNLEPYTPDKDYWAFVRNSCQ